MTFHDWTAGTLPVWICAVTGLALLWVEMRKWPPGGARASLSA